MRSRAARPKRTERLVIAGALVLASGSIAGARPFKHLAPGDALPRITLPSIAGKPVSLPTLGGKALVLLYLRAGQQRSRAALDDLARLLRAYAPRGLAAVVVTRDSSGHGEALRRLARQRLPRLALLVDRDDALKGAAGVFVYPTTGIFDGRHRLRFAYAGRRPDYPARLKQAVERALGLAPRAGARPMAEATTEQPSAARRQGMQRVMRQLQLRRARRRLEGARQVLGVKTLPMVFELFDAWARLLAAPEHPVLARAARAARGESGALTTAIAQLEPLVDDPRLGPRARLWLGRALAARQQTRGARAAFTACLDAPPVRGQCAFELARLVATDDPQRAVSLCEKGYQQALAAEAPR